MPELAPVLVSARERALVPVPELVLALSVAALVSVLVPAQHTRPPARRLE